MKQGQFRVEVGRCCPGNCRRTLISLWLAPLRPVINGKATGRWRPLRQELSATPCNCCRGQHRPTTPRNWSFI